MSISELSLVGSVPFPVSSVTDFSGAVEEDDELDVDLAVHGLLPAVQVVLVTREAVNEELVRAALLHRLRHIHTVLSDVTKEVLVMSVRVMPVTYSENGTSIGHSK